MIIGARSLDEGERELIKENGIKVFTMHEVDRMGMTQVMEEAIITLKEKTDGVHLSLDLMGWIQVTLLGSELRFLVVSATVKATWRWKCLLNPDMITSAEFVEVNPILDDKNKTASVAVALMGSLFGEKLL